MKRKQNLAINHARRKLMLLKIEPIFFLKQSQKILINLVVKNFNFFFLFSFFFFNSTTFFFFFSRRIYWNINAYMSIVESIGLRNAVEFLNTLLTPAAKAKALYHVIDSIRAVKLLLLPELVSIAFKFIYFFFFFIQLSVFARIKINS